MTMEDRRIAVLRALVEEHIHTGEPVSSRSILDATGLEVSGATVRNELASLDREGFAVQPHTSAGRVPTAKAYRYYVDNLTPERLRDGTQQRIAGFFSSVQLELGRLLKATTELLSEITHYPAVAMTAAPSAELVKASHLVQLGAKTALLVVVTESGHVSQELCRLSVPTTPAELEEAERVLAKHVVGRELGTGLVVPMGLSAGARAVLDDIAGAMHRVSDESADVYVGGTRQMATVWDNLSTVHRVLEVLEREAMLLNIMARTPGTTIQIGGEIPVSDAGDMAVVSASYEAGAGAGRVGVIGPMRMDYKRVISAVEGVSRELGERIGS